MSFGSRIRKAREYQCLNQRELAELLGVTPSAIANYENDYSVPIHNILVRMFSTLEIDANYLYYDYLGSSVTEKKTILSSNEVNMLKKIRALDEHGMQIVNAIIDLEYNRVCD